VNPFVPNSNDRRPRMDGYWDKLGVHVSPRSLYLRQLEDRAGVAAVMNIEQTPVGGGALDMPTIEENLPLLEGIRIDNRPLPGFSPTVFDYVVALPAEAAAVPDVRAHDERHLIEYVPASHPDGKTVLIVRSRSDSTKSVRYTLRFITEP
jgi:hypothetical protein